MTPRMLVRVIAMASLVGGATTGCEDDTPLPPPPPRERSNIVVDTATTTHSSTPTATVTASAAGPSKAPRKLCTGSTADLTFPKGAVQVAKATGGTPPPAAIPFGAGKWIWVNLWAAWCVPCKEEMPRLFRWNGELRRAGVLVDFAFVSLDDDERQLQRFLDDQPSAGLRASYWLPEQTRGEWLRSFGLSENAQLPVQILVSPRGDVRCIIEGAVEDQDYAQLLAVLKRK